MTLDAFGRWMVKQNIEHAKTEGTAVVVAKLRANGYPEVANAVEMAGHECPNPTSLPRTVAEINALNCGHNCPECGEPLRALDDQVMYCQDGCYQRPLNKDDPYDIDCLDDASERYWLGRNGF